MQRRLCQSKKKAHFFQKLWVNQDLIPEHTLVIEVDELILPRHQVIQMKDLLRCRLRFPGTQEIVINDKNEVIKGVAMVLFAIERGAEKVPVQIQSAIRLTFPRHGKD
jgi:hypothetical protein